jgi:dTDP-4-amino-4,6-dideoxygalactose transaminase
LVKNLENYFKINKILLTPSGRCGLYVLLSCLEQQKVFIPAYTCKAVVEAIKLSQKEIEFIEVEDNSFNIDCEDLRGRLDADSILVITHQFGFCAEIDQLTAIAKEVGAIVLEDAAASFGSRYKGTLTGTFGQAGFFSFDSTKLVNTPLKGGFIVFNDQDLFIKCKEFISQNLIKLPLLMKIYFFIMGIALCIISNNFLYNFFHWIKFKRKGLYTDEAFPSANRLGHFYLYQLSEFQAKVLNIQLEIIDIIVSRRIYIYKRYLTGFKNLKSILLPPPIDNNGDVPIRFPIRVAGDKIKFYLKCLDSDFDLAFSFTFIDCPINYYKSINIAKSILDLPFYYSIKDSEIDYIINKVLKLDLGC